MVTMRQVHVMAPKTSEMMLMVRSLASPLPKMMAKLVRWSQSQMVRVWTDSRRLKVQPVSFQDSEPKSQNTHVGNRSWV